MLCSPDHSVSVDDADDSVQAYLREIGSIPPLTIGEEAELSHQVLAHNYQAESAGRRLIEANLVLVVTIAKRRQAAGIHVLDLIQKAMTAFCSRCRHLQTRLGKPFRLMPPNV